MSKPLQEPDQLPVDGWVPEDPPPMGGPELTAAFICEKVLREADGVVTAVRIVDRADVTYSIPFPLSDLEAARYPEDGPPLPGAHYTLYIIVRGIWSAERHVLGIVLNHPGVARAPVSRHVFDLGPEAADPMAIRGATFNIDLSITSKSSAGLLWFELYIDDRYAGRVPFFLDQTLAYISSDEQPPQGDPDPSASELETETSPPPMNESPLVG